MTDDKKKILKGLAEKYGTIFSNDQYYVIALTRDAKGLHIEMDYKGMDSLTVLGFFEAQAAKIRVDLVNRIAQDEAAHFAQLQDLEPKEKPNYMG